MLENNAADIEFKRILGEANPADICLLAELIACEIARIKQEGVERETGSV